MDFAKMFRKIAEFTPATWIAIAALIVLSVILLVVARKKSKWSATTLAFASLAIALSFLLSYIRLYKLPQGGSITPASMLPLMLFSYAFGMVPGLLSGVAYGLLQLLQDPTILTPMQVILDYPLAFAMTAFAGILGAWARKGGSDRVALGVGITLACALRFVCAVLSGVLFFAEYAQGSGYSPVVYSVVYNGSYMLPETVICLVVGLLVGPRLSKVLRRSAGV